MIRWTRKNTDSRVLVLGVNPFEDMPGYQLLCLLRTEDNGRLFAADDSSVAVRLLEGAGANIHLTPQAIPGSHDHVDAVLRLCKNLRIDVLLPASDAHLVNLAMLYPFESAAFPKCAFAGFVRKHRLLNKCAIQEWLSSIGRVPEQWMFRDVSDLLQWEESHDYPVMVKGMRKGAIKCRDRADATSARRAILENPANLGDKGGAFLQAYVDGEEHSVLVATGAHGNILASLGLKKLATTKLGTTVAAELEEPSSTSVDAARIAERLGGTGVVEVEYRLAKDGIEWLFEANFRFPSWVGALGSYGQYLLRSFVASLSGTQAQNSSPPPTYPVGALIYRLPQSGFLSLPDAFHLARSQQPVSEISRERSSPRRLLWTSSSPHQFCTK